MVVDDLDLGRARLGIPAEAHSILVIDSNRVLIGPIPPQGLQAISRRHAEIFKPRGGRELIEFQTRDYPQRNWAGQARCARVPPHHHVPGPLAAELHLKIVSLFDNIVKR